jgi:predicted peptidase
MDIEMKLILTLLGFLTIAVLVTGCSSVKQTVSTKPGQQAQSFSKEYTRTEKLDYLFYLPKEYGQDNNKIPLLLFLHGSGERGNDVNLVAKHGPPKLISEGKDFPFIVVSPQCPDGLWWTMDSQLEILNDMVENICDNYNVDKDRIYITGLSMGGYGTWSMLAKYPDKFAAAVPICGGGDSLLVNRYCKIPIWVFHGAKDNVVPVAQSESMVNALKKCGSNVKFTVYPEAGHNSWEETYNNPEVFKWILEQHK